MKYIRVGFASRIYLNPQINRSRARSTYLTGAGAVNSSSSSFQQIHESLFKCFVIVTNGQDKDRVQRVEPGCAGLNKE